MWECGQLRGGDTGVRWMWGTVPKPEPPLIFMIGNPNTGVFLHYKEGFKVYLVCCSASCAGFGKGRDGSEVLEGSEVA
jgi:hypothetical protein